MLGCFLRLIWGRMILLLFIVIFVIVVVLYGGSLEINLVKG